MTDPRTRSLAVRFEEKVDRSPGLGPNGDCHEWTAGISVKGYGRMNTGGHSGPVAYAHVVAWFIATGEWPSEPTPFVLHACDNPLCVRTDTTGIYVIRGVFRARRGHLWLGTQVDNVADMLTKKRHRPVPGELNGRAKLTTQQVQYIRSRRGSQTQQSLADEFGVSRSTISHVQNNRIWRVDD